MNRVKFTNNNKNSILGFTLAEVLIVLTMLGIMMALTIPAIAQRFQDAQNAEKFRQFFSQLSQATLTLQSKNGDIDFNSGDVTLRDQYSTVMNFIKTDAANNLFAPFYIFYKNTSGMGHDYSVITSASALLSNGAVMEFHAASCTWSPCGYLQNVCAEFRLDVNGRKGPNMTGKDYFALYIIKNNGYYQVVPLRGNDCGACQNPATTWGDSNACTKVILQNQPLP